MGGNGMKQGVLAWFVGEPTSQARAAAEHARAEAPPAPGGGGAPTRVESKGEPRRAAAGAARAEGIMTAQSAPAVERLWTVEDVMAFLRRSRRWVYGHADELGAIREFGGLRFDPAALRARAQAGGKMVTFPKGR